MNQGPIWGRFMKKTRGQKSRATVPLSAQFRFPEICDEQFVCDYCTAIGNLKSLDTPLCSNPLGRRDYPVYSSPGVILDTRVPHRLLSGDTLESSLQQKLLDEKTGDKPRYTVP